MSRFFGELRRQLDLGGATLSETWYPEGFTAESHAHDRAFLCFVLRGRYCESYGASRRECEPFAAIYHPPGGSHSDRFHSAGACFNIEIASTVAADNAPATALAPRCCSIPVTPCCAGRRNTVPRREATRRSLSLLRAQHGGRRRGGQRPGIRVGAGDGYSVLMVWAGSTDVDRITGPRLATTAASARTRAAAP